MVRGMMQLELYRPDSSEPAVVGTDYCVWIDGRWSHARTIAHLEYVADNAIARSGLEWRRSVYLLGGRYKSITV
jgi:hypothetical protein